jgi:2-methylcitrate dehydratase PrpD
VAGLTRRLAEHVASIGYGELPTEAVETMKRGAIDCMGVMFAGRDEPVVQVLSKTISKGEEASLLFDRGRAASADAALVNAAAAHALDYDDTGLDGHPSVALVPAIFAEGERLGANGKELIAAYVAGYETWAELIWRDADKHHGKGWHPTAVFGTLAAAAAAARLSRSGPEVTAHALGIAASMAAGLVANFGSMAKPFQVGRAAQSGVLAARLAAAGMTASADALEHRSGFLAAVSPKGRFDAERGVKPWHIVRHGVNIKRYPVCYALHRAIDTALELDFPVEKIQSIEIRLGKHQAGMLRHSAPQTGIDAKFSAEFAVAAALLQRRVGLAELSNDFVRSARVQSLMRKVRVTTTEEADADEPLFAPFDILAVRLNDGSVQIKNSKRHAKGHSRQPLSMDELRAKFDDCTAGKQAALFERLLRLEEFGVRALIHATRS